MDTRRSVNRSLLITPYGGELKDLVADAEEAAELRAHADNLPSITLSRRSICDLELLATGAFSPLDRFMNRADYRSVLDEMRLLSGEVFPVPITLPTADASLRENTGVTLRDTSHNPLAVLSIEEIYEWDRTEYARKVLRTGSVRHPLVTELGSWADRFVSGPIRVIQLPRHYDFLELRMTPSEVRARLETRGTSDVVAFQTRNPLHRGHEEILKHAIEKTNGVLLLHPVVGMTKAGDIEYYDRVRSYKVLAENYLPPDRVQLALLLLAMRFAGPREAVLHALIRRNYGANHFIVGRDHASPGVDENGKAFYEPYEAQKLLERFSAELGVVPLPFEEVVYLPDEGVYRERSKVSKGSSFIALSGKSAREDYLDKGRPLPSWFVRPEVAQILQESSPPRYQQGLCLWFTGLSGAGKSTIAEIVTAILTSRGRKVTLLDGDVVRTNLSAGLGFDRPGRDANIRRIGFVALEIVRHGGVAICAAISPYRETRNEVRKMISENFVEIFVDTPLEVCEQRDSKGMYARARRGEIKNFTGVDDVYEPPVAAEIVLDNASNSAEANAGAVIEYLLAAGFIRDDTNLELTNL